MKLALVIALTALSSLTAWAYSHYEFHVSYLIILISMYVTIYYGVNRKVSKVRRPPQA